MDLVDAAVARSSVLRSVRFPEELSRYGMVLFLAVGVTAHQTVGRLVLILAGGRGAFVASSQSDPAKRAETPRMVPEETSAGIQASEKFVWDFGSVPRIRSLRRSLIPSQVIPDLQSRTMGSFSHWSVRVPCRLWIRISSTLVTNL